MIVIGRLIIDFVKTIKADEKVFTDYKDWISGEIIKYYVIYFIKIFINNYNKKDIQKNCIQMPAICSEQFFFIISRFLRSVLINNN